MKNTSPPLYFKIFIAAVALSMAQFSFAIPNALTIQTRIADPTGAPLDASAVHFRFSVTDSLGTCVLFQEDFVGVNMSGSKGLMALELGRGTNLFPGGVYTLQQLFNNFGSPLFSCQNGGTYTAGPNDLRKLVMQFNDGTGWQTTPPTSINSVPWAFEAGQAHALGQYPASHYVRLAQITNCNPGEALHFNNSTFTCVSLTSGVSIGGNSTGGTLAIGTNDSNSLNLETNGVAHVFIDATGNVGVGAASSGARFQTQSSGAKTSQDTGNLLSNTSSSSTNGISKTGLDVQSTGVWNGVGAVNVGLNVNVSGGTTNYAAIFNGGNVGIGTTTPIGHLNVRSEAGTPVRVNFSQGGFTHSAGQDVSDVNSVLQIQGTHHANGGAIIRGNAGSGNGLTLLGYLNSLVPTSAGTRIAAGKWNSASATQNVGSTERILDVSNYDGVPLVSFLGSGSVGIGTVTPAERLEINGAIKVGSTTGSNAGTIRWDGVNFQGYNGTAWSNFVPSPPSSGACDTANIYSVAGVYAYTVPASFGTITIRLWGGGGTGGLSDSAVGGQNGQNSSISSLGLTAGGGMRGQSVNQNETASIASSGGIATGGDINTNGSNGGLPGGGVSGAGGNSPNGGLGGAGISANLPGLSGVAPGGGGSGAYNSTRSSNAGGGGAGAYTEKTFTPATLAPGATIADIIVGAGGSTLQTGLNVAGNGGTGRVSIVCSTAGTPILNNRSILFLNSGTHATNTNFVFSSEGNLGVGTGSPGVSNLVELSSTTKGFVLPRMTKVQRDSIPVPVEGMMIYQTDNTPGLRVYNGVNWVRFTETID